ncbi:hypothetical protein NZA98_04865, partial [Escherichia coli]|nr:hypothetical protein [Escherichia coli]
EFIRTAEMASADAAPVNFELAAINYPNSVLSFREGHSRIAATGCARWARHSLRAMSKISPYCLELLLQAAVL